MQPELKKIKIKLLSSSLILICSVHLSMLYGQMELPQDYEFKYSYTEDVITSYKVNDAKSLSDLNKNCFTCTQVVWLTKYSYEL